MSTIPDQDTSPSASGQLARWERHNSERQLRILEAAVELIEENPVGAEIPVQIIAKRAGLAKSVVYRQFNGRDDLDRRIRSYIVARFTEVMDAKLDIAEGSLRDILTRTVQAVADWSLDHSQLHDYLRKGPTAEDESSDAVSTLKRIVADKAHAIITAISTMIGVDDEPFESLPFAVVTMVEGTMTYWVRDPETPVDRVRLVNDLSTYAWFVIDGAARLSGLEIDADAPLVAVINQLMAINRAQA